MPSSRRRFLQHVGLTISGLSLSPFGNLLLGQESGTAVATPVGGLPRSLPDAQNVAAEGILKFVERIERLKLNLHSLMLVRNGHVVAEGWWAPYAPNLKHTLYSLSKSFASTGVGLAAAEGKLKLDDKVVSFFPKELPAEVSPHLAAMRVKDLLMMGSGHADDCLFGGGYGMPEGSWVKSALSRPVPHEPGTFFRYNSGATFLLSAIVQTATGQTLLDYITPRLLKPLGIVGADWESNPLGQSVGGWGLRVRTEDIARFGQLYLQQGMWEGKRLLPAEWVAEATSRQIDNAPMSDASAREKSDWAQGYGYQFWRCRHDGVRGDGAFGQYCLVLPKQQAVLAMTSESSDMQGILNAVWEELLPAMGSERPTASDETQARLQKTLSALTLPLPTGAETSPTAERVSGKSFRIAENPLKFDRASFEFGDRKAVVTLHDDKGAHAYRCGIGSWERSETDVDPVTLKLVPTVVAGETKFPIAVAGAWSDAKTFQLRVQYIETAHYDTFTCRFDGDKLAVEFRRSLSVLNPAMKDNRPVLAGTLETT